MKKIVGGAVAVLIAGAGLVGFSASATATPQDEPCVPSDAKTETQTTDWLIEAPEGEGWEVIETRTVTDAEAVYKTEYFVGFYLQTDWLLEQPDERAWTQIAERKVIDQEFVPGEYEQSGWVTESPGEGWKQIAKRWVIDVEAQPEQGTPTIVIPNPDYVPGWTETIEHPAEYKTLWKYTKHGGHGFIWVDNDTWKYIDSDGNGSDKKPGKGVTYYERTQHTKQEKVKNAWTETIEHPAQGEETIEVTNPDYVPAVEEQGHWEYKFAWYVAPIPERSHQEYKYALYIAPEWVDEVPTGDGWKVKDQRRTLVSEAETHEEFIFQREVEIPAVECPVDEPTVPEDPTETPTVPEEPTTPVEEPTVPEEPTTPVEEPEEPTEEPSNTSSRFLRAEDESETLAETGVSFGGLLVAALILLVGGGLIASAVTRRRG